MVTAVTTIIARPARNKDFTANFKGESARTGIRLWKVDCVGMEGVGITASTVLGDARRAV